MAALLVMPVPYYLAEVEWAPVLRLAFLTALFLAVALAEGGGTLWALIGIGSVQAFAYAGLFWLAAGLGAWALARIGSAPLRAAALGTALFLLLTSALLPLYETPLSSTRLRSSLWQIFD